MSPRLTAMCCAEGASVHFDQRLWVCIVDTLLKPDANEKSSRTETQPVSDVKISIMLNIYNGDSTAGTASKANIPGEHLAWREALVYGPAPGNLTQAEFLDVRAKHLAAAYHVPLEKCQTELQAQHEALKDFPAHEEVVLWFDHDLFCQIHLVYLLDWFSHHDLGKTKLSLICIDRFPGIEDFRGLGQLNEEQLASVFPARREIRSAQLELGSRAWRAYSSSEPAEIELLLKAGTDALSFLSSALAKHLERFPSVRNGVGRVGDVCLELLADGHRDFKSLFPAFGRHEPLYGFGDAQVFLELERLAKAKQPLLAMSKAAGVSPMDSRQLLDASFELTDTGRAVLNGEADFVRLNGIDLWLGGVHLEGEVALGFCNANC